jgi:hypothetical protein
MRRLGQARAPEAVWVAGRGEDLPFGEGSVDLVLLFPGGGVWAVEVKRSLDPRPSRGFHEALKDLRPQMAFVVYPGAEAFPLGEGVLAAPLYEVMGRLWAG